MNRRGFFARVIAASLAIAGVSKAVAAKPFVASRFQSTWNILPGGLYERVTIGFVETSESFPTSILKIPAGYKRGLVEFFITKDASKIHYRIVDREMPTSAG